MLDACEDYVDKLSTGQFVGEKGRPAVLIAVPAQNPFCLNISQVHLRPLVACC